MLYGARAFLRKIGKCCEESLSWCLELWCPEVSKLQSLEASNSKKIASSKVCTCRSSEAWYLHNFLHPIRDYVRQMHATIRCSTRLRLHGLIVYDVYFLPFSIFVSRWICFGLSTYFTPHVSSGCLCDCTLGHEVKKLVNDFYAGSLD